MASWALGCSGCLAPAAGALTDAVATARIDIHRPMTSQVIEERSSVPRARGGLPAFGRVGRDGGCVAVQVSIEPVHLPVQAFDEVLRLAGARQVVVLAREEDDLARHAEMLQRTEPLLPLLD